MPGVTVGEFECRLCSQQFTLLTADFMIPEPNFCDECLTKVWNMEDEELAKHVAACLASNESQPTKKAESHSGEQWSVDSVVQHINRYREWSESAEDMIRDRKRMR